MSSIYYREENREQRTENKEQRTENREQRTKNKEQRTENREQRTENRDPTSENREQRVENTGYTVFFSAMHLIDLLVLQLVKKSYQLIWLYIITMDMKNDIREDK